MNPAPSDHLTIKAIRFAKLNKKEEGAG